MIVKGGDKLPGNIKTVLVIQIGDIGDVVLSLPVLQALKENLPGISLIYAVRAKAASLARECEWVDNVVAIDTDRRNWAETIRYQISFFKNLWSYHIDLTIDLRMDPRGSVLTALSRARHRMGFCLQGGNIWRNRIFTHLWDPPPIPGQHMIEYLLRLPGAFGINAASLTPRIQPSGQNRQAASDLFSRAGVSDNVPVVAVQPFSLWRYKEWGDEKFTGLIRRLVNNKHLQIIILGGPEDAKRATTMAEKAAVPGVQSFAGETPIGMLPAILERCILSIGGDSAGIHIAAAVGTPTIGIYGPSAAHIWAPRGQGHRVIQKDFPCLPCEQKGCNGSGVSKCLNEMSIEEVFASVETQLEIRN